VRRKRHLARLIDDEAGGQRIKAAVELRDGIVSQQNPVVDFVIGNVRLNGRPAVLIHGNTENGEPLRFVTLLKFGEPGNFDAAGPTPSGPKIEENDFAAIIGQLDRCAIGVFQREIRGDGAMLRWFNGARVDLLG
jgi:hypothetical protein